MSQQTTVLTTPPVGRATELPRVAPDALPQDFVLYERLTRLIQSVIGVLGVCLLTPVFLCIALAIKLTDRGRVFYRGERVGRNERIFRIWKFRTLVEGAEAKIGVRLLNSEDRSLYCGRIGRLLKRTKLDELPQLFNVIRGEMRLVGPRPSRPIFLEASKRDIPNYRSRFAVPPGITGIAQLRGGYYTPPRNKLRYDLVYINNRSILLDLKLVALTFVKILNRWLNMGLFVVFLFLFVSFVPQSVQPSVDVGVAEMRMSLVYLLIAVASAWVMLKRGPGDFVLYRCPLNLPILAFALLSTVSAVLSDDPYGSLQGAGYYLITGLLLAFLIVNSLGTREFVTLTIRAIALTSVLISLLGLFQIFLFNYWTSASATGPNGALLETSTRISSILGNPVVLAVYLVLGIPVLLCEVSRARTQRSRDFWLVCTTLSCVGVFFTQTRVGLLALFVTGTLFLYRRRWQAALFAAAFLACFAGLTLLAMPRLSLPRMLEDVAEWIERERTTLHAIDAKTWVLGAGASTVHRLVDNEGPESAATRGRGPSGLSRNMHWRLVLEHGITGWLVFMWVVLASLRAMKRTHDRLKDDRLKIVLWAIISSVVGFLISMNAMNTFHHLTIQVFFWSLMGIGLGIAVRPGGTRRHNLIWRFGEGGD